MRQQQAAGGPVPAGADGYGTPGRRAMLEQLALVQAAEARRN